MASFRDGAELTQKAPNKKLGLKYYTVMRQWETGLILVPPELYAALANIFDIDPKSFAKEMMRHYNFFSYQALFGSHPDLSDAALEKERKLTIGKSNEDPKGDGG